MPAAQELIALSRQVSGKLQEEIDMDKETPLAPI